MRRSYGSSVKINGRQPEKVAIKYHTRPPTPASLSDCSDLTNAVNSGKKGFRDFLRRE
jgi:hypothetical protein